MNSKTFLIILATILSLVSIINAQKPSRTPYPESYYNRDPNNERLKKISIKLELADDYHNKKSLKNFSKEKDVYLRVLAKSSDRIIALGYSRMRRFRPVLLDNKGVVIPYTLAKQEQLREEWRYIELLNSENSIGRQSGPSDFIGEKEWSKWMFNIDNWYGKLEPGIYKISVLFGFGESENEKKIKTNIIKFKVY